MAGLNFNRAEFVRSAVSTSQFIRSSRPAVVFAGKSNVGKSSVINRLLNRKNLARVGSTPGKTVHINYFLIDEKLYFVDLPGYGYADVPRSEKERWAGLMEAFFAESGLMSLGVQIVDARHKPTEGDIQMIQGKWFPQGSDLSEALSVRGAVFGRGLDELDRVSGDAAAVIRAVIRDYGYLVRNA